MPFSPGNRVRVSAQDSQYRNHLGTVQRIGSGSGQTQEVFVRIDGHEASGEVLFEDQDLKTTTLDSPITY